MMDRVLEANAWTVNEYLNDAGNGLQSAPRVLLSHVILLSISHSRCLYHCS